MDTHIQDKNRDILFSFAVLVLVALIIAINCPPERHDGIYIDRNTGERAYNIKGQITDSQRSEATKLLTSIDFEIGSFTVKTESVATGGKGIDGSSQPDNSGAGKTEKAVADGGGPDKRPIHAGSAEQQQYIDYAWDISHDRTFIYLLKAESGALSPTAKSKKVGSNGYRDYGLCQVNKGYHKGIVNDPRFFTDWKWQLDQCYRLYKGGTKFYGLANINRVKKFFTWI